MKRTTIKLTSAALAASMAISFAACSKQDQPQEASKTVITSEKIEVEKEDETEVPASETSEFDDGKETEVTEATEELVESSKIPGIWQSATMTAYDDDMHPAYYVMFSDTAINYGQIKDDNIFGFDHADKITLFEEISEGIYRVQAESSTGVKYTFQTAETDKDVMEYFETWDENEFASAYRGGASLSKCV